MSQNSCSGAVTNRSGLDSRLSTGFKLNTRLPFAPTGCWKGVFALTRTSRIYNICRARIRLSLEIFLATEWTKTWGAKWNHNTATGESNRKAGRADVYTKAGGLMEPAKHTLFLFVAARYLTQQGSANETRTFFVFMFVRTASVFRL